MPPLNKSARIPPLNTLRLIPANKILPAQYNRWPFDQGFFYQQIIKYFQQPSYYYQKVNTSDRITIYLDCLAAAGIDILVLDQDSNTVATLVSALPYTDSAPTNTDSYFHNQYYTYVYQFLPSDISLPDGVYHIAVKAIYAADPDPLTDTIFISEPIQVLKNWDNTMLLEYSNSENDYDVFFDLSITSTPRPWAFRVESYIDIDPAMHDTSFENMFYQVEKLQSIPFRVGELIIGGNSGVPPWVLDKVNRIISCDTFTVDGVQWEKEPNANWSFKKADNYSMKCGTIKLRDNPENPEWEFNNSNDPDTFRIHTDEFSDEFS